MLKHRARGFTMVDVLAVLAALVVLTAVVLGAMARAADVHRGASSTDNLRTLGAAHAVYAADWNDRQLTLIDDFITTYGATIGQAMIGYRNVNGFCHLAR